MTELSFLTDLSLNNFQLVWSLKRWIIILVYLKLNFWSECKCIDWSDAAADVTLRHTTHNESFNVVD